MCAQTRLDEGNRVPGLLAVRALRASLGVPLPPDRVSLGLDDRILDDREAADLLSAMSPVRCSASAEAARVVIHCRELDIQEQEQEQRYFQLTEGWLGELGRAALASSRQPLVLVTGGGEPLVVDAEHVDAVARKFIIDVDGFTVSGRYPNDEELLSGVAWVLQISGRNPR